MDWQTGPSSFSPQYQSLSQTASDSTSCPCKLNLNEKQIKAWLFACISSTHSHLFQNMTSPSLLQAQISVLLNEDKSLTQWPKMKSWLRFQRNRNIWQAGMYILKISGIFYIFLGSPMSSVNEQQLPLTSGPLPLQVRCCKPWAPGDPFPKNHHSSWQNPAR